MITSNKRSTVLVIIVLAQFCCTSIWFAGNAILPDLQENFNLGNNALGYLTSSVQAGFIIGTLVFAFLSLADRFSPSKVFAVSAIAAALLNSAILIISGSLSSLILLRFFTGFMLAGIYPVGMKIAADYHEKGLGKALGFLVGALVLGTSFPHLVKTFSGALPWQSVLIVTSTLSLIGGLSMVVFVPDGPYIKPATKLDLRVIFKVFKTKDFKKAAFGYFGHCWELYAFWAFVPLFIQHHMEINNGGLSNPSFYSFLVIGVGSIGCIIGGYISNRKGSKAVALYSLLLSGLFCLLSPFLIGLPFGIFISCLIIWGMLVISDSPQFSTLVAQSAPKENIGSALTIVNSIGFLITIFSIQLLDYLKDIIDIKYLFVVLVAGPIFGVLNFSQNK